MIGAGKQAEEAEVGETLAGALRVAQGGHDVPADVVRRRFGRSLNNFFDLYLPLADEWTLFDNSTTPHARAVAAQLANQLTVMEPTTWHKLNRLSKIV